MRSWIYGWRMLVVWQSSGRRDLCVESANTLGSVGLWSEVPRATLYSTILGWLAPKSLGHIPYKNTWQPEEDQKSVSKIHVRVSFVGLQGFWVFMLLVQEPIMISYHTLYGGSILSASRVTCFLKAFLNILMPHVFCSTAEKWGRILWYGENPWSMICDFRLWHWPCICGYINASYRNNRNRK